MSYTTGAAYFSAPTPAFAPRGGLEQIALYASAVANPTEPMPLQSYHTPTMTFDTAHRALSQTVYHHHQSIDYQHNPHGGGNYDSHASSGGHTEYSFQPDNFLKPGMLGQFVGDATEIEPHIREAFEKTVAEKFPDDLSITICDEAQFRSLMPNPGVIGFSLNRKAQGGVNEIFVLAGTLGRVMLTVGHEIGHVMTQTLSNKHDEEAKAFAFSYAWMDTIKKHDIAGLAGALVFDNPANNGLHDVAHRFVHDALSQGSEAITLFTQLVRGSLTWHTPS